MESTKEFVILNFLSHGGLKYCCISCLIIKCTYYVEILFLLIKQCINSCVLTHAMFFKSIYRPMYVEIKIYINDAIFWIINFLWVVGLMMLFIQHWISNLVNLLPLWAL